jgi:cytochrome P450 family 142 subfamily A polypeptide 1
VSTTEARTVDLLDGYLYAGDPYPTYAWLRHHAPVYWDSINGIWGISRYRDVMAVEKNSSRYSSARGSRPLIEHSTSMINMDDPGHQRQRSIVARQFTPRAVKQLEDRIRAVVTDLIDNVCENGFCDVVADLAVPLPAILIAERLGYPPDLWSRAAYWSEVTMQGGGGPRFHTRASEKAVEEFAAITWQLIGERRAEPRDDLISLWCHKEVDGRRFTEAEIIQEALLLLDGGAETTRTVIGRTVQTLMDHPDQRQLLIDDPSILGATGVEEFIRWVTPILNMRRTATEDHVFEGQHIKAGDQLLLMYSSANRDEEAFDEPDRFDVTRSHNNHVAFGFGTHFCLGASLARLEIRVMFEELVRRVPDMRLAAFADPRLQPSAFACGLKDLKVEFTPTARQGGTIANG